MSGGQENSRPPSLGRLCWTNQKPQLFSWGLWFSLLGARGHGAGLVDRDLAATEVRTIEHGDCLVGNGIIRHLHEREAARAVGHAVHRDVDGHNFTGLREVLLEFLIRSAVRNTTNEKLGRHA